jgi:hypothetical protein
MPDPAPTPPADMPSWIEQRCNAMIDQIDHYVEAKNSLHGIEDYEWLEEEYDAKIEVLSMDMTAICEEFS